MSAGLVQDEWRAWADPAQATLLGAIARDQDNARAALAFALSTRDAELALTIGQGLGLFWFEYGHFEEARSLLEAILAPIEGEPDPRYGWILLSAGVLDRIQGRSEAAERPHSLALDLFRQAGDDRGAGFALAHLAADLLSQGAHEQARERINESLELLRRIGDRFDTALALTSLGLFVLAEGRLTEAEHIFQECLAAHDRPSERSSALVVLINLAECRVLLGDRKGADAAYREILASPLDGAIGYVPCHALDGLAILATLDRRTERAARLWGASETGLASMRAVLDTSLGEQRAKAMASARETLSDDEFERLLAEGRAMSPDDAIAYALEDELSEGR